VLFRSCWLCQSALPPYEQRPRFEQGVAPPRIAGEAGAQARAGRLEPDFVIWSLAALVAAAVMVIVVIDVAVLGGIGYAILTALGCTPVIGALAFMMWMRRPSEAGTSTRGESREQSTLVRIVGGIAMAVGAMLAVMVLIGLLVLALLVLLFIACIAAEGGHL
jgi:uncharacterized iron-regulated membrane protein